MNRLNSIVVAVSLWLAVGTTCFVAFSGCQGCASANQTAYRATGVAVVTVNAAMKAWGDWVSKNHPGAATEQKVADAYAKYQKSVTLVADAGIAYTDAKAKSDPALPAAQASLNIAMATAAAALVDLEQLIISFGVKL